MKTLLAIIILLATFSAQNVLAKISQPSSTTERNMTHIMMDAAVFMPELSEVINTNGFKLLDLCTPYSVHIGQTILDQDGKSAGSCAGLLGILKTDCESSVRDQLGLCTDPRYIN